MKRLYEVARWLCSKCHSYNGMGSVKCAWCGAAKPTNTKK